MFSFRKKIFITYAVLSILFIAVTFPIATHMVRMIAFQAMQDRADDVIKKLVTAKDNEDLVAHLKEQKYQIFFRVAIITNEKKVLYDSHAKRKLGEEFSSEFIVDHPEVNEAFVKGIGYNEDYSELLDVDLIYLAKAFPFHGKTYVIRVAFPFRYFDELAKDTEKGFLVLVSSILLLFSFITWFIMNRLTSPIQQIIQAVEPYQDDTRAPMPEIHLKNVNPNDQFNKLANTLNSLTSKIQKNIDTITEERNEKEAILESLVEGVVAVDKNMNVIFVNETAQRFLGKTEEELVGHNFTAAQEPEGYAILLECQAERNPITTSIDIQRGNTKLYLDIVAAPLGKERGAILVMQDKSSHYKMLEMRKDFIANASHELKTPITIIRGFAETLHDNPDLPKETTAQITDKIVNNCLRMTALIRDLLTLSDIENIPESRLTECDLGAIVELCANHVRELHPDADIKISTTPAGEEMLIVADHNLMEHAMMNLIENAAKYSLGVAHIDIGIKKEERDLVITISDKGIGIPQADQEHIFERFYRVNKTQSKKVGGSGLGLSIVQTIIHKHFGSIKVTSEADKGTTFTITLPRG